MNEFTFGALAGVSAGAASAALVGVLVRRRQADTDEIVLSPEDHAAIAVGFQTHAEAMRRQVSEYADALAGGDLVLREQLRRVERGTNS